MSQPNLCPGSWQLTTSSSASTSALNFISSPPMMKPSCPGSSLVMSAGFMVTTLRKINNPPSGKAPLHQGQKRPDRWKAMSTAWSSLSLTSSGLCTKNLSQQTKMWISDSTATFCGDCMKTCEAVAPNIGENRPGCFTTAHTSIFIHQFLAKNKMAVIPHPTCSPDLAPCYLFLFPKMKFKLKVRRFDNNEEIQTESQKVLDTLIEKDFQKAFQKWRRRWDRCLNVEGNYFEGNGGR